MSLRKTLLSATAMTLFGMTKRTGSAISTSTMVTRSG